MMVDSDSKHAYRVVSGALGASSAGRQIPAQKARLVSCGPQRWSRPLPPPTEAASKTTVNGMTWVLTLLSEIMPFSGFAPALVRPHRVSANVVPTLDWSQHLDPQCYTRAFSTSLLADFARWQELCELVRFCGDDLSRTHAGRRNPA